MYRTTVFTVKISWHRPYSNGSEVRAYELVYTDDFGKRCSQIVMSNALDQSSHVQELVISDLLPGSLLLEMQASSPSLPARLSFSRNASRLTLTRCT